MQINTWHQALSQCEQQGCAYVLVTLIASAGSVPREAGTKMVVTGDTQFDTIGGGHLEYEAVNKARTLLIEGVSSQKIVSMPLASKLGQCCGGAVKVLYEVMVNHQQHLAIFGAGHVAQALVPILAQLPLQIRWVDSREDFFSDKPSGGSMPLAAKIAQTHDNVVSIINDDPTQELANLPDGTWVVILTHNHQLDYSLIQTALKHPGLDFIGMIGSHTKAKRFRTRLTHRGYDLEKIEKIVSPIGDLSVTGKRPVEVAVSISAQLIRLLNRQGSDERKIMQKVEDKQGLESLTLVSGEQK